MMMTHRKQFTDAEEQPQCEEKQYMEEEMDKCCARCPPGYYIKEKCSASSVTLCKPCSDGTYAANWNHATRCRHCYPCPSGLVMKQKCSAAHATVCGCPDGYNCTSRNGVGDCIECEPIAAAPTESLPTQIPDSFPSNDYSLYIIPALVLVVVIILAVGCYYRVSIMRKIGRTLKFKKHMESTPECETAGPDTIAYVKGAAHGCQLDPLLVQKSHDCTISLPMQEEGKDLSYPIQETDSSHTGECTLNST
ncbi:tumor necrosis factor receptor superfamily member 3 isoform X2 [Pseudophryne corroboree]|uniref:tumor necrosis factor receptor superfamily member 3 isoform X2 n=1 Tax=Pseudophryne corroboree TaxID=495146 RepID=UPI0030816A06